jgi:hypothetical protein
MNDTTCLELFFDCRERLLGNRTEYEREFGVAPGVDIVPRITD